jgi:hypothetical protein
MKWLDNAAATLVEEIADFFCAGMTAAAYLAVAWAALALFLRFNSLA